MPPPPRPRGNARPLRVPGSRRCGPETTKTGARISLHESGPVVSLIQRPDEGPGTRPGRGSPMYAAERQQRIIAEARRAGRVEVTALADTLGVAAETVRRDLTALERRGSLRRVHGG